jgi:hypothetical protein
MSMMLISTGVYAKKISYDYVGAGYVSLTTSSLGFDLDGSAFEAAGSYSLTPNIAVSANYINESYNRYLGYKLTGNAFSIGVTGHTSIAPAMDIYGNFSVISGDAKVDFNGTTVASNSDTGNVITVGLRAMASEQIELELSGNRTDLFGDTTNSFTVNAGYYVNDKVMIGVGYTSSSDVDGYIVSVKYDLK